MQYKANVTNYVHSLAFLIKNDSADLADEKALLLDSLFNRPAGPVLKKWKTNIFLKN